MTFEEACQIANCELAKIGREGLTKIIDLGDCWYFWGGNPSIKPLGFTPVIIFKETGTVTDWMYFTFIMNRSDKDGIFLPIPPKFAYAGDVCSDKVSL